MEITPDARAPMHMHLHGTLHPPFRWDQTKRPRRWLACDLFLHSLQRPSTCADALPRASLQAAAYRLLGPRAARAGYRSGTVPESGWRCATLPRVRRPVEERVISGMLRASGRVRRGDWERFVVSARGMVRVLLSVQPNWAIYNVLTVLTTGSYFIREPFQRCHDHHPSGRCSGVCQASVC